jgi:hypothetical protein
MIDMVYISDTEKLSMVTRFKFDEDLDVTIEKRGYNSWCVSVFGSVLDRELNRHYEPMPSSRTDEFIEMTRFSLDEAFNIANDYCEKMYNK